MDSKRLLQIADMCETIPQGHWDMDTWWAENVHGSTCGSVGCAIGHAIHRGLLPELAIRRDKPTGSVCIVSADSNKAPPFDTWRYTFTAVGEALGLDEEETEFLFGGDVDNYEHDEVAEGSAYITPKGQARHIRRFVERGLPQRGAAQ